MAAESALEKKCREWAEASGWYQSKYVAPGKKSVPDRIFIKNGVVIFGEIKAPGERPTRQQELRHKEMRDHGALVFWWDNFDEFKQDLRRF